MKVRLQQRLQAQHFLLPTFNKQQIRALSLSVPRSSNSSSTPSAPAPATGNARWLSDIKARIGKCIMFGMSGDQTQEAATVMKAIGEEWRALVAGREGFLVGRKRAGLLRQAVVWGEMDRMEHVNNVMYIRYAESARVNWAYNYAVHIDPEHGKEWMDSVTPNGFGMILKSMRTDYKFPMAWPDHISVFHKLSYLPSASESSFVLDVMILSELHQRPAARCVEDIVVYDYLKKRKATIRPFMLKAFEQTWAEQEAEKIRVEKRIREIENAVRNIEQATWDRKDAVEDMGGR
ncbi:thioesterase-like superfamily-domain-containing protein [Cadophora sp. MPI-SDFR-AT-0126]|nr:thioesterase-like superfamily-domain-containing protein [Leotiomycetes sp. MPI-SDFR-AT-0126]